MQRTGFVPYFLSAWGDGSDNWVTRRDHARTFTGPAARRIASQLNAQRPAAVLPVGIEAVP